MKSYILVLLLPVACFVLFYFNYFMVVYRESVRGHAESALQAAANELQRISEEFGRIAMQDSALGYTRSGYLKEDPRSEELFSLLKREKATHLYVSDIIFYNEDMPGRIYTTAGSYEPAYYRISRYYGETGLEEPDLFLENEASSGWFPARKEDGSQEVSFLDYIVPVSANGTRHVWIFRLDSARLRQILEAEHAFTAVFDSQGRCLCAVGREPELAGGVEIAAVSADGTLQIKRTLEEEWLFAEVTENRNRFLAGIFLVLLAGSVLSLFFSIRGSRPMEQMKKDLRQLEALNRQDRFLLELLYRPGGASSDIMAYLQKEQMFVRANRYYVVVASILSGQDGAGPGNAGGCQRVLSEGPYELRFSGNSGGDILAGVLGVEGESADPAPFLRKAEEILREETGMMPVLRVEGPCSSLSDIHGLYLEAMRTDGQENTAEGGGFRYPELEMKALYDAVLDGDPDMLGVMTDALLERIRGCPQDSFAYLVLSHDVLRLFELAARKKGLKAADESCGGESGIPDWQAVSAAAQTGGCLPELIERARDWTMSRLAAEGMQSRGQKLAASVMEYIEAHVSDPEITVNRIADLYRMSASNLSHQFKIQTNRNLSDYLVERKFEYARKMLAETDENVSAVAEAVGYVQSGSFIRRFRKIYGMTPMEYRQACRKEEGRQQDDFIG